MFDLLSNYIYLPVAVAVLLLYIFNRWYRSEFVPDFHEKYVLITGTDCGIGHKLALDLDNAGVHVYAGCLTVEGAENLKLKTSSRLKTLILDITDQKSVDEAARFVENDLPRGKYLWGLVNNAGILGSVCFELTKLEDYKQLMEVNFFGPIRVTEAFEPLIKKAQGRIVNINSVFGRGSPAVFPYACSKFACQPYTDGLRRSLKDLGVKVAIIEPGYMPGTGISHEKVWIDNINSYWNRISEAKRAELGGESFKTNWVDFLNEGFKLCPNYNSIDMVSEAVSHALGAKHPKFRYPCGHDARIFIFYAAFTPDWFVDLIRNIVVWVVNMSMKHSNSYSL